MGRAAFTEAVRVVIVSTVVTPSPTLEVVSIVIRHVPDIKFAGYPNNGYQTLLDTEYPAKTVISNPGYL